MPTNTCSGLSPVKRTSHPLKPLALNNQPLTWLLASKPAFMVMMAAGALGSQAVPSSRDHCMRTGRANAWDSKAAS